MPDRTEPGDIASLTLEDLDRLDGVLDDDELEADPGDELSDEVDEPLPTEIEDGDEIEPES